MRKRLIVAVLLMLTGVAHATVAVTGSQHPRTADEDVAATRETIREGLFDIRNNDWDAAASALDSAIHSRGFANLPEDARYPVLLMAGQLAENASKHDVAYPLLVQASESSKAEAEAWHARLSVAYELSNYADSGLCITTIARQWPTTLDEIRSNAIFDIARHLRNGPHPNDQIPMLLALFNAKWVSDEGEPSNFWRDLALFQFNQGEHAQSKATAARIRSARVAIEMRIDKRYDGLTQANPGAFDIDRLAAVELADARLLAKAAPDRLRPLVALQTVLLDARRYDEVVAIADDVIARSADDKGASIFTDFSDQYIWVLDQRARALVGLGRTQDAVAQWVRSTKHPEHGEVNVSQTLNLGEYYADLQRPREALDVVSELGSMSPYGRMQLEFVQLQVAIEQADKRAEATHLAYMREHRDDAIRTWESALLMEGDLDGAANLLVERLASDKWRGQALIDVQHYQGIPLTPMGAQRELRWNSVVSRPAVVDAVNKVGRIEHFNLAGEET